MKKWFYEFGNQIITAILLIPLIFSELFIGCFIFLVDLFNRLSYILHITIDKLRNKRKQR